VKRRLTWTFLRAWTKISRTHLCSRGSWPRTRCSAAEVWVARKKTAGMVTMIHPKRHFQTNLYQAIGAGATSVLRCSHSTHDVIYSAPFYQASNLSRHTLYVVRPGSKSLCLRSVYCLAPCGCRSERRPDADWVMRSLMHRAFARTC
jgi:hypothetical protein